MQIVAALIWLSALGSQLWAQGCYIDPNTGQQVCPSQPGGGQGLWPSTLDPRRSTPAATPIPARCRIFVGGDGSCGSGTLVESGEQGAGSADLVLTCGHLFDDSRSEIVCEFPDGRRFGGILIDMDRPHDLAAIAIRPTGIAPVSIADGEPTGQLAAGGFGGDGQFAAARGQIVANRRPLPAGATYPCAVMTGGVRPGDSGGAVTNQNKQLVGVLWGCDGAETFFTCGRPLREFWARIRGRGRGSSGEGRGPGGEGRGSRVESQTPGLAPPVQPLNPALPPAAQPVEREQIARLETELAAVRDAVKAIPPGATGERGPPGETGPPGSPGEPGANGATPEIDTSQFATRAELAAAAAGRAAQFGMNHLLIALGLTTGGAGIAAYIGGRIARRGVEKLIARRNPPVAGGPPAATFPEYRI